MQTKLPKMILFDYGHTLIYDTAFDSQKGWEAVLERATGNSRGVSVQELEAIAKRVLGCYGEIGAGRYDIPTRLGMRFVFEYLGLELSVSTEEAETVYWDAASPGGLMPDADKMIDYINSLGIRSAVVSNINWSQSTMKRRIDKYLPGNRFEFIIASCEYLFRKPNELIFSLALSKAGLDAGDVWFCGDNVECDVEGSSGAGMFPVWYENRELENYWGEKKRREPGCEHLHINSWQELCDTLRKIQ